MQGRIEKGRSHHLGTADIISYLSFLAKLQSSLKVQQF